MKMAESEGRSSCTQAMRIKRLPDCKWFEARIHNISREIMIVRVSVVLRRTVCDNTDWRIDNLSGNVSQCHHKTVLLRTTLRMQKKLYVFSTFFIWWREKLQCWNRDFNPVLSHTKSGTQTLNLSLVWKKCLLVSKYISTDEKGKHILLG